MPQVLNQRKLFGKQYPHRTIYVGRPGIWGNPHVISKAGEKCRICKRPHDREDAVKAYLKDINDKDVDRIRHVLKGLDLVCWCAPELCHADVLVAIANASSATEGLAEAYCIAYERAHRWERL